MIFRLCSGWLVVHGMIIYDLSCHGTNSNKTKVGMSVFNKNGCLLVLKCDRINYLSNRKNRSDFNPVKNFDDIFFLWWEGKDVKILKVCEQTAIIIYNNRALKFFVYFVNLDDSLDISKIKKMQYLNAVFYHVQPHFYLNQLFFSY